MHYNTGVKYVLVFVCECVRFHHCPQFYTGAKYWTYIVWKRGATTYIVKVKVQSTLVSYNILLATMISHVNIV